MSENSISLVGIIGAIIMSIGGLMAQNALVNFGAFTIIVGIIMVIAWFVLWCRLVTNGEPISQIHSKNIQPKKNERQDIINDYEPLLKEAREKNKASWFRKSDLEIREEVRNKIQDRLFDLRRKNNQTLGNSMYWKVVSDEEKEKRLGDMMSDWSAVPYLH